MAGDKTGKTTRVYTGSDGVMVPVITETEKIKRRDTIRAKRRRSGKKCKLILTGHMNAAASFALKPAK